MNPGPNHYEWHIPATLASVDQLCAEFCDCLTGPKLAPHIFALQLLLREALNNAVLHGCVNNPAGGVQCVLTLLENEARLCVTDAGPGFDWQAALRGDVCAGNLEGGRGLRIYQLYAHRIEFNTAGNQVTLARRLDDRPLESD